MNHAFHDSGHHIPMQPRTESPFIAAFEAMPAIALLLSADAPFFTIRALSDKALQNHHPAITREATIGKHLFTAFPPASDLYEQQIRDAFHHVLTHHSEQILSPHRYDFTHADGSKEEHYWAVTLKPVMSVESEVQHILMIVENKTEQVLSNQQEEKIKALQQAQHLLMNAPAAMCVLKGAAWTIELANQQALDMVGLTTDIIGLPLLQVLPHLANDHFLHVLQHVKTTGKSYKAYDVPLMMKDKDTMQQVFMNYIYQPYYEKGETQPSGVFVMANDVTEKVLWERKKEASEQNLSSVLSNAPIAVTIFRGADFVIETINEKALDIWNKTRDEVIHQPLFSVFPLPENQVVKEQLETVFYSGTTLHELEHIITVCKNDREEKVYLNCTYKPLIDHDNKVVGVISVSIDVTNHVASRKKIEDSEARLRLALEAGEMGTFDFNVQTNELKWSPKTYELFGMLPGSNIDYDTYLKGIHPDDRENSIKIARQQVQLPGGVYELEYRTIGITDGKTRWVRSKGKAVYDNHGNVVSYTGITQEITRQRLAEHALKESEQRVRSIIESAPFPIGVYVGREMRIAMTNESILKAWGRGKDVIGKLYADVLPELAGKGIYEQLDSVYTTGEAFHTKNSRVDLLINGELQPFYFNYSFTPLFDTNGNVYGVMNTAADVTDLNIAKQQIEKSEKEFRQLANTLPALVWTTDAQGQQGFISLRWKDFTGIEPRDEHTFRAMVHPEDADVALSAWAESMQKNTTYKSELRMLDKHGKYHWFFAHGEPLFNEDGTVEKWIGTFTNIQERKQHEEELKNTFEKLEESEKRFRNIVKQAPMGIVILRGSDFVVDTANETYLQLVDKTASEFIGRPLYDSLPEAKDYVDPLLRGVLTSGEPYYAVEFPIVLKRNNTPQQLYFDFVYYPLQDEAGNIDVIAVATEVTGSVQARLALEASEKQFRKMIMQSPVGMAILRGQNGFVEIANTVMVEQIFQKHVKSVLGNNLLDIFPELLSQKYPALLQHTMNTGQPHRESEALLYLQGQDGLRKMYVDYEIAVLSQPGDSEPAIIATVNDVTEKVEARHKVEESERRFRHVADSAPVLIWMSGTDSASSFTNKAWQQFTGMSNEQQAGDGWLQCVHPDDRQHCKNEYLNAFTNREQFYTEYRLRRNDGVYRWISNTGVPRITSDGMFEGFIGACMDIHEQKMQAIELERMVADRTRELQQAKNVLEQKNVDLQVMNKELESFAYVASHDLQEPLRKIQTFTGLITEKDAEQLSPQSRFYFQRIQNASRRMKQLIEDLLTYSRTNIADKKMEEVDIAAIVKEVKADLREDIENKKAVLEITQSCKVKIVRFQFHQLILNLVTNSLKFAQPGQVPHITITCEQPVIPNLTHPRLQADMRYSHIRVSDNGIGFDPQYSERIFEMFQRLHGRAEYEGTGIGLAIVKKIVDNYNGIITATGIPDQGATFDIYLPIDEKA